jgi:chromosome segregation ATPase
MTDRTKDDGMTPEQIAERRALAERMNDHEIGDLCDIITTLQQEKAALEREREKLAAQLEMERTYRWDYEATIQRLREALEWCAQAVLDISNAPTDGRYVPRRTELRDAAVGIFTRANAALAATPTEDR